jgi:hypothetical protein
MNNNIGKKIFSSTIHINKKNISRCNATKCKNDLSVLLTYCRAAAFARYNDRNALSKAGFISSALYIIIWCRKKCAIFRYYRDGVPV